MSVKPMNMAQSYSGTSLDDKPTDGVYQGSSFTELDTGDVYMYESESGWTKQFSLQGGGGGGGGGGASGMVVEFEFVDAGDYDKYMKSETLADDVLAVYLAGGSVVFHFPTAEGGWSQEKYASLVGYDPDEYSYSPFIIDSNASGSFNGSSVDQSGYIKFTIYVD